MPSLTMSVLGSEAETRVPVTALRVGRSLGTKLAFDLMVSRVHAHAGSFRKPAY